MANEYGRGVAPDIAAALAWYAKSAEQGYCPAQRVLAQKYFFGDDVSKNYVQAFRWYESLAQHGHPFAMSVVGLMHRKGWGVTQSTTQAEYWEDQAEEARRRLSRDGEIDWFTPEAVCWWNRTATRSAAVPTLGVRFHLQGHLDPVADLAFSRDGTRLFSAGEGDEAIFVWDLMRGTKQSEVVVPGDPLRIEAHGERVLVRILGKRVAVGRITSGRFEQQDVPDGRVERLPSIRWPLSIIQKVEGHDGAFYVHTPTGQRLESVPPGPSGGPTGFAISPDLKRIVYSTPDGSGTLHVWDVAGAREERRIAAHYPVWIMAVAYSPNGRYVASSGNNMSQVVDATTMRNIRLWDVASGREVRGFLAADGFVMAHTLGFSPDGTRLAAVGTNFKAEHIYVFDVASGLELTRIQPVAGKGENFRALAFSPDSQQLAVAYGSDVFLYALPTP